MGSPDTVGEGIDNEDWAWVLSGATLAPATGGSGMGVLTIGFSLSLLNTISSFFDNVPILPTISTSFCSPVKIKLINRSSDVLRRIMNPTINAPKNTSTAPSVEIASAKIFQTASPAIPAWVSPIKEANIIPTPRGTLGLPISDLTLNKRKLAVIKNGGSPYIPQPM